MNVRKIAILAILTAVAYGATSLAQLLALHFMPPFIRHSGAILLSPKNAIVCDVFCRCFLMSVTTGGQDLFGQFP